MQTIHSYYQTLLDYPEKQPQGLLEKFTPLLVQVKQKVPEVLFITSFPPRQCGIATYSQDLMNALSAQFGDSFKLSVCALETNSEKHLYDAPPRLVLNTEEKNAFAKAAFYINKDPHIQLVVLQHEFGFYAKRESDFREMLQRLTKPVVLVFHTVLPGPDLALKLSVQFMAGVAAAIIVMTNDAASVLSEYYAVPRYKIHVIAHGTHLVTPINRDALKKQYGLHNKKVLSTFGLLSSSKSIETSLDALPAIVEKHPDVLFLVLGKTHPGIVQHEGEQYRNMLERKVAQLGLHNHVQFVNAYLPLQTLLEYLQVSDVYLFTSKDPNQAVSGTFSYAVSCGCPVVSTPIPHAKEVLQHNNGLIIDFENSTQLSKAAIALLDNDTLRDELSLNSMYRMASTVWPNAAIAHALLFDELLTGQHQLHYRFPAINTAHMHTMTTAVGMLQFARYSIPDLHSGYTLDDNARALIAIAQHYVLSGEEADLALLMKYLDFIAYCLQKDGRFYNYVNEWQQFTIQNQQENTEDSTGRAIWALGYLCSLENVLPHSIVDTAASLMQKAIPHLTDIYSTRAMAFIIKGLYYQNKPNCQELIEVFANRMVAMYQHEKTDDWHWFEGYLTYANGLLPEAMLCAYVRTGYSLYHDVAKASFNFLIAHIFKYDRIKVVSNKTWHWKGSKPKPVLGGEQPIDVAYTILALERFYKVFGEENYRTKAVTAFNWFLGDNHLHQIVYNPCTGGCYDGVEEHSVNLNQGAESTVSYLMARLAIDRLTRDNGI
jgi:glycosyltransferase involved in cell wall biosynthesis/uncharacterized protein YyaL (SSP411 family)